MICDFLLRIVNRSECSADGDFNTPTVLEQVVFCYGQFVECPIYKGAFRSAMKKEMAVPQKIVKEAEAKQAS